MKRVILTALALMLVLSAGFSQEQSTSAGSSQTQVPGAAPVPAATPSTTEPSPAPETRPMAFGLVQNGSRNAEGRDFLVLADPAGGEFLLSADAPPDAARVQAILSLLAALKGWSGADFSEFRVINYAGRFQLLAIPSQFAVAGKDVSSRITGGLQFFYQKGSYEYDFRFKAGDFYLRVRGIFSGPADLALVLERAQKDPVAYVNATDPLFALRKFEEEDARTTALEGQVAQLKSALADSEAQLKTAQDRLAKLDMVDKLAKDLESQKALQVRYYAAIATALNSGKAIKVELVQKVIDARAADPKFDKTKGVAKFKEAGLTVTQREVDAIFMAVFLE